MTNNREWNNFVSSWQRRRDEILDEKCKEKPSDNCYDIQSCVKSLCRSIGVSVPVTVRPIAVPGEPKAKGTGEFEVNPCGKSCDNEMKFTITQNMNVDIPMLFGAEICFDEACAEDNGECDDEDDRTCQ
ncbi:MAG: hypothetical protein FWE11_02480 [Defluviitaleaceae bacterium]|nr:hypothetical protein [Defluviitaleaceae bacterium]